MSDPLQGTGSVFPARTESVGEVASPEAPAPAEPSAPPAAATPPSARPASRGFHGDLLEHRLRDATVGGRHVSGTSAAGPGSPAAEVTQRLARLSEAVSRFGNASPLGGDSAEVSWIRSQLGEISAAVENGSARGSVEGLRSALRSLDAVSQAVDDFRGNRDPATAISARDRAAAALSSCLRSVGAAVDPQISPALARAQLLLARNDPQTVSALAPISLGTAPAPPPWPAEPSNAPSPESPQGGAPQGTSSVAGSAPPADGRLREILDQTHERLEQISGAFDWVDRGSHVLPERFRHAVERLGEALGHVQDATAAARILERVTSLDHDMELMQRARHGSAADREAAARAFGATFDAMCTGISRIAEHIPVVGSTIGRIADEAATTFNPAWFAHMVRILGPDRAANQLAHMDDPDARRAGEGLLRSE